MGRSLGAVSAGTAPEFDKPVQFVHPKTGRRYRVFRKGTRSLIEEFVLDREKRPVYSDLRGVDYVIGSGTHARSFLLQRFDRLYQLPVTFYTQTGLWDMSPGYDTQEYVGFTRRVTANCLFCHAGRVNAVNRAGDRFAPKNTFAELAIGCERCHGPGRKHLAQPGKAIVNPAKLNPPLRDQVCEQCHLMGAARVPQPGVSLSDFHPGESLSKYVAIYGHELPASGEMTVTGHPEQMKKSRCWQASQGKLWCGSCHRIHPGAAAPGRIALYRERCQSCHDRAACTRPPDPSNPAHRENNCIHCHMPSRTVVESAHVTFTDHHILRKPRPEPASAPQTTKLKLLLPPVSNDPQLTARNLGFAYASLGDSTGRPDFYRLVIQTLLPLADTELADSEFWENAGTAYLMLEQIPEAKAAFEKAVERNPRSSSAWYSLGFTHQARQQLPEAIECYQKAVELDPQKAEALGNLAAAHMKTGNPKRAAAALEAALLVEPGNLYWRQVLTSLRDSLK
jgi:hypothetical protein